MKHILLLLTFCFSVHASAQAPAVWSNDFSDPTEWISTSEGGISDFWSIGLTGPAGTFPILPINSLTALNGFALFDSDWSCSGNQIANLTYNDVIDCSGLYSVEIKFAQMYQRFNDSTFVYVSNDNGLTWDKYSVNTNYVTNSISNNPELVVLDISTTAANSSQVKIRFQFWSPSDYQGPANGGPGCGYAWMIDDVSVGPKSNSLDGYTFYDENQNGQFDVDELGIPHVPLTINEYTFYSNNTGYYLAEFPSNNLVQLDLPAHLSASTSSYQTTFSTEYGQSENFDFPIQINSMVADLQLNLFSLSVINPGFSTYFKAIVQNNGTTSESGTITVELPENFGTTSILPSGSVANGNLITFPFNNLQPFTSQEYLLVFVVSPPPTIIAGSVLTFSASLSEIANDLHPEDNATVLIETAVGSYDPNDILMTRGPIVSPSSVQQGDWFTYRIRFQNSGSYQTTFIKVNDQLSPQLDWSTFEPIATSHPAEVTLKETGELEYNFPDIVLLPDTVDLELSQGYILYRIKPLPTLSIGQIVQNQAFIYFDFNEAIITNIDTVRIDVPQGLTKTSKAEVLLYPNPARNVLTISSSTNEKPKLLAITVSDVSGRIVYQENKRETTFLANQIDISLLKSGFYQLTCETSTGRFTKSFVKN